MVQRVVQSITFVCTVITGISDISNSLRDYWGSFCEHYLLLVKVQWHCTVKAGLQWMKSWINLKSEPSITKKRDTDWELPEGRKVGGLGENGEEIKQNQNKPELKQKQKPDKDSSVVIARGKGQGQEGGRGQTGNKWWWKEILLWVVSAWYSMQAMCYRVVHLKSIWFYWPTSSNKFNLKKEEKEKWSQCLELPSLLFNHFSSGWCWPVCSLSCGTEFK